MITKNNRNSISKPKSMGYFFIALALALALTMAAGFPAHSIAATDTFSPSYIAASQSTLVFGQKLTYSIHLINNSDTPANANVSDKVPAELAYVADSADNGGMYFPASTLLTWDNVSVPALGEVVLNFQVTPAAVVTETLQVVNKASIQVISENGLGEISTRSVMINLAPGEPPTPGLVNAYKTASQATLAPGEKLTYTIQVINSGAEAITANISDPLPSELVFVDGSQSSGGVYDPVAKLLTWRNVVVNPMAEVDVTFDVKTAADSISDPVDVVNVATVAFNEEQLKPEVKITLVSTPQRNDVTRPEVTKVVIGDQDVVTDPNVVLHITASSDAKWMFIREYAVKSFYGIPYWGVDHSSGWIPFDPNPQWTLGSLSGVHYVAVKIANADLSSSLVTHDSLDFVSLNLPDTVMSMPGFIPYQVYYGANTTVTIDLKPSSGSADLYVWYPGNFAAPDQTSLQPGTALDTVTFNTADKPGVYIILVYATEPATFNLTIQPPGGPHVTTTGMPTLLSGASVQAGAFSYEPVFTNNGYAIGLDPLGSAQEIGSINFIRLPMVQR